MNRIIEQDQIVLTQLHPWFYGHVFSDLLFSVCTAEREANYGTCRQFFKRVKWWLNWSEPLKFILIFMPWNLLLKKFNDSNQFDHHTMFESFVMHATSNVDDNNIYIYDKAFCCRNMGHLAYVIWNNSVLSFTILSYMLWN